MLKKKLITIILSFCILAVGSLSVVASNEEDICISQESYEVIQENDIKGLLELGLEQLNEKPDVMLLNEIDGKTSSDTSLYVEQIIEEKEFMDGHIEQTKMLSVIDVVDPETGVPLAASYIYGTALFPNKINNSYCYVVQTLYFTAEYSASGMQLINRFRPDKLSANVQSGGSNIMVLYQKGYMTGTAAWEEGPHEVNQTINNPINGGTYEVACGINRFLNKTSTFYHMEVGVVLSNGTPFSSSTYIFKTYPEE